MNTTTADLTDLMNLADYPWYLGRWGFPTITTPDEEYSIRIQEDDGTFYLTVLSGGKSELIHTELRFCGIAAQLCILAAIDALVADLS